MIHSQDPLDEKLKSLRFAQWTAREHKHELRTRLLGECASLADNKTYTRSLRVSRVAILLSICGALAAGGTVLAAAGGVDKLRSWFIYRVEKNKSDGTTRFSIEKVSERDGELERTAIPVSEGVRPTMTHQIGSDGKVTVRGPQGEDAQGSVIRWEYTDGEVRATIITGPDAPDRAELLIKSK